MTRYLDPVLLWTVAATATSRVRLNASTLSTFYCEPAHLARLLTALDILSDGRLAVGVGQAGWMKDEHDIVRGADWHRRGKMFGDVLAFLHAWWTTTTVSEDSEFFSQPPAYADLRPVQADGPPIWTGGASEAAMRRVGRSGAGWPGFEGLPDEGRRSAVAVGGVKGGIDAQAGEPVVVASTGRWPGRTGARRSWSGRRRR